MGNLIVLPDTIWSQIMTENRSQCIVVGIDGSAGSLAALRWALREGGIRRVRVDVVHCWQAQLLPGVVFGPLHEMHTGSVCMVHNEVAAALVGIDPPPEVVQTSVQGHPARTLLSRAAGTSLIVLGVHESPKLRDLVYGRVAVKCLKHAVGPVVIIGRDGLPVFRSERQPVDMPADAMASEKVSVSTS